MRISASPVFLLLLGASVLTAQQSDKPSPYTGVSQPPADDTIVATPDATPHATPAPVKPATTVTRTTPANAYAVVSSGPVPAPAPASTTSTVASTPAATQPEVQHRSNIPDSDMVYVQENPASLPEPATSAQLARRPDPGPDGDIVHVRPTPAGELPEGTPIHVHLLEDLSSKQTVQGQRFSAQVSEDVTLHGKVIIPTGSTIRGRVTQVKLGARLGGRAALRLRPDVVVMPDGTRYQIHAQVVDTEGSDTRADNEGSIVPKSHLKHNGIMYAGAMGGGAVAGAAIAGAPGALVGTLIGAGAVTTHVIMSNPQTDLPTGSAITFGLTEPMDLAPIQN